MNVFVIYDTLLGNTEQLAAAMAHTLQAQAAVRLQRADQTDIRDLKHADLLVVGGPTQRHGPSPPMRTLLRQIRPGSLRGVPAVCFETRYRKPRWLTGSAAQEIAKYLQTGGCTLLLPPESFFIVFNTTRLEDGERARAHAWAAALLATLAARRPLARVELG